MWKAIQKARRHWAPLAVVVGVVSGCSGKEAIATKPETRTLTISNGIGQNSLSANSLWANSLWANGLVSNSLWANSLWANSLWANSLWANSLWANSLWANGLSGDQRVPGDTLRNNGYLRQLLRYVYSCAFPPETYDTELDPNDGALLCVSDQDCELGYACSPAGTCVVPLRGAIGVGINDDGTSWGEAGACDESCRRWISACVLARTNAYGVKVLISMRAPADAPQRIKDALAVTDFERNGDETNAPFSLREGAYYGDIFATRPVFAPGGGQFTGEVSTPVYNACAGPGSNIPAITKRFCSSQGDQVVIKVPGACLGTSLQPPVCEGEDTDPASPTFGAIQDCRTTSGPGGELYKEVITVYLRQPIATCGNAVCEDGEEGDAGCPSDCHAGSWARSFSPSIEGGYVEDYAAINQPTDYFRTRYGMSALGPDDSIVVAGTAAGDVDLGRGSLSASQGIGILAKYNPDGALAWGVRFGTTSESESGGQLQQVNGVTVAANGNITVVGVAYVLVDGVRYNAIWIGTYAADGALIGAHGLLVSPNLDSARPDLHPGRVLAVDSEGSVIMGGTYDGRTSVFGEAPTTSNAPYLAKVSSAGALGWWKSNQTSDLQSVSVDAADNVIVVSTGEIKKFARDGAPLWTQGLSRTGRVGAVDATGNVFVSGFFTRYDFDLGGILGPDDDRDTLSYLIKYDADGVFQWVRYPTTICPVSGCRIQTEVRPRVYGAGIGFDALGEVVLATFGDPYVGGGIDFGAGTFPTYNAANIFLAAYSPEGTFSWAKHIPMTLKSSLLSMSVDSRGRVVVGGNYSGSMQVDGRLLVTDKPEDPDVVSSFLASFGSPPALDGTPPSIGVASSADGAPISTVPQPIFAQATGADGAVVFFLPPTALDEGNAGASVSCFPPPNTAFSVGTTTVTCTAADPRGNRASASFAVTVVDTIGPVFAPVADLTVEATSASGASVNYAVPAATDQVSGPAEVSCDGPPPGGLFPVGRTTVSCTGTDAADNRSGVTFAVEVRASGAGQGGTCDRTATSAGDGRARSSGNTATCSALFEGQVPPIPPRRPIDIPPPLWR